MITEPRRIGMFPLSTVLYPYAPLPLHVFEPRYRALTAECLAGDRTFGVVLIDRGSEVGGGDERVAVGTLAEIVEASSLPDGRWVVVARGAQRIRVSEWLPDDPYPCALVEPVGTTPAAGAAPLGQAESSVRRVRALLSELGEAPAIPPGMDLGDEPEEVGWRLCAMAPLNLIDGQRLLEADDPGARMALLIELSDALSEDLSRLLAQGGGPSS